jgi:DNA-binding NtrC family response regulator
MVQDTVARDLVAFLVEDDQAMREVLAEVLRDEGVRVVPFGAIDELRTVAQLLKPNVIVADGWGNSYDRLTDDERRDIAEVGRIAPVILVSGRQWVNDVTPAELGVSCILGKPLELEHLIDQVHRCLSSLTWDG